MSKSKNGCEGRQWRSGLGAKAYAKPPPDPALGKGLVASERKDARAADRGPGTARGTRREERCGRPTLEGGISEVGFMGGLCQDYRGGLLQVQMLGAISDSPNWRLPAGAWSLLCEQAPWAIIFRRGLRSPQ